MTIDEAITKNEQRAECYKLGIGLSYEEYEQTAVWLKELKELRENRQSIINKTLDDCREAVRDIVIGGYYTDEHVYINWDDFCDVISRLKANNNSESKSESISYTTIQKLPNDSKLVKKVNEIIDVINKITEKL